MPSSTHRLLLDRCGANPALHSFPTRRSSDLGVTRALRGESDWHFSWKNKNENASARGLLALVQAGINARTGDRKSTRLNSSHVKISYAVFCLKKKIIHT